MSALARGIWDGERNAVVQAASFPEASEERAMRTWLRDLRDTTLILAVQLLLQATILLRRLNF
ncbi:MAG: hypothetical protein ACRD4S_12640 [Candidatus Acidiferrales bacterium]